MNLTPTIDRTKRVWSRKMMIPLDGGESDASGWGDNLGSIRGLDTLLGVRLARLPDLAEPGPLVNFMISSVFKRKNNYMTKYGTKKCTF